MKRFFEGLTFKIGIAVILIQIAALTTMGFYYINRFSGEIDRSMQTRIETPGMLMTQGMLTYEAVSDRTIMEELIGETLIDSLVIGLNQQIFYALNPNDVGRDVNSILDPQFVAQLEEITIQSKSTQMTDGLVNITPLSLRDGKLVGFLYLKIGTEQLARQKRLVALVFILGSIFCIFSTSIGIILLFRSIILTRIGKLLAVSQQVASGSLTARINGPISQDEIGILQHSINLMAAELEKTIGNLHAEIAERIKAGAALRASESWFRTIYDGVNDAIFIHDANTGAILDVNRKACEMYGYSQAEMLQLRIADVSQGYPPFGQQEATALVQKTQTQGPQLFEWRAKDRNGHLFWVEVNLRQARIYGQDRVLAAVRDITERKQAEELREALIEELEAKNTELERFTYTVSHDLKSPLITIGGFVGFLAKDALAGNVERVKTDIARINDATAKMQQLLNELLELSRIGRLMNPPEEVSFEAIAREA
ncbi:MAG: PAS domain S-box protein, partial [Anaerolineae bacterium]|nr:PAS domain S-box protein [Anaerolineae bacterium]